MNRARLMSAALLVALLGGYWFTLARGELREIRGLLSDLRSLQSQRSLGELRASYLATSQNETSQVHGWLETVIDSHTVEGAASDFVLQADAELRACGLKVSKTEPSSVFERQELKEQSLEVSVEGSVEDLLAFVRRMEGTRPFCRVTSMRILPQLSNQGISARLVLTRLWREV